MKKIFPILVMVVFLSAGCGYVYKPPVAPVCLQPAYSESVICALGKYLKVEPEQMHDIIIDATLLGLGTKIVDGPALRKSTAKIRTYVIDKDLLTMEGLVKYVMAEADINPAFALLLQRRLPDFGGVPQLSTLALKPIDITMIKWELDQVDEYLAWF